MTDDTIKKIKMNIIQDALRRVLEKENYFVAELENLKRGRQEAYHYIVDELIFEIQKFGTKRVVVKYAKN